MELAAIYKGISWRVDGVRSRLRLRLRAWSAFVWRRLMFRTTVIAVTGSVGKTTTKELLRAILEKYAPTVATTGNHNIQKFGGLEETLLRVRPWHRFAVVEAGIERPGDMAANVKLLRPDIGLMLAVKRCHTNVFKTIEALAREKGEMVRHLKPHARAILNLDNSYVAAMAGEANCPVVGFGHSEGARFRLLNVTSRWPERMVMHIAVDGAEHEVRTRLVGAHWATAVMAALTTAVVCGVPLDQAISAIGRVEPSWARMQPMTLPGSGAVLIRDEWNGSIDTFEAAFKVMAEADAERKIVVASDYSDSTARLRTRAKRLGQWVAEIADMGVFIGEHADYARAAAISKGIPESCAYSFPTIARATGFLRRELKHGDLVLLKGQTNHHLSRVYLGLLGDVGCTLDTCALQHLCDSCPHLGFKPFTDLQGTGLVATSSAGV